MEAIVKVIQVGDVANVARTLTKGLRSSQEVDARLMIMPKPADSVEPDAEGIEVIRTNYRLITHSILLSRLFGKYSDCDIFHAHAMYNVALMLVNKLMVSHFHGDDLLELASGDSFMSRLMVRSMHRTRRILVSTPDLLKCVERLGIDMTKVTFLPNPIETDRFKPNNNSSALGDDDGTVKLFHPTRFQDKKHNDRLLRAYAELQDRYPLSLYLIENKYQSPLHDRMQKMIDELRLRNVHFLPLVPHHQLADYYSAADIVLDQFDLPIMCLVSLEGLSCGKPVVSAFPDDGSYPESPPVYSGYTVEEIKRSLEYLLENRERWEDIGAKGRQWIMNNHDITVVSYRLKSIYQELLENKS